MKDIIVLQLDNITLATFGMVLDDMGEVGNYILCLNQEMMLENLSFEHPQILITGSLSHLVGQNSRCDLRSLRVQFPYLVCVSFSEIHLIGPFELRLEKDNLNPAGWAEQIKSVVRRFRAGTLRRTS